MTSRSENHILTAETSRSSFSEEVKEASTILLTSVGLPRNKRPRIHQAILLCSALLAVLIVACGLANLYTRGYSSSYGCDASGTVSQDTRISQWNPRHALRINIGFGHLPFWKARLIDISWDLVIGRGCQILCAYYVYSIFRTVMAVFIKNESLAHEQILAAEYSTTSLSSLWTYFKSYRRHRQAKSGRCSFPFTLLFVSVLHVLIMPTWLSAMTGYPAFMEPHLPLGNNEMISFTHLYKCNAIIEDGYRIRLDHNTCVHHGTELYTALMDCLYHRCLIQMHEY